MGDRRERFPRRDDRQRFSRTGKTDRGYGDDSNRHSDTPAEEPEYYVFTAGVAKRMIVSNGKVRRIPWRKGTVEDHRDNWIVIKEFLQNPKQSTPMKVKK
jgi:hypothetical protein